MLDHIGLTATDLDRSKTFYDQALAAVGITVVMSGGGALGYGSQDRPYFWIGAGGPATGRLHVAFTAEDRASVDAFYAAALAAGGRDNGPPGIRADYHPNYYGAFVLDPDGHNIEAVCHRPE
jgi:catechol 2,3-dioxygenase-like lactoylglutathione lyase family enzyme